LANSSGVGQVTDPLPLMRMLSGHSISTPEASVASQASLEVAWFQSPTIIDRDRLNALRTAVIFDEKTLALANGSVSVRRGWINIGPKRPSSI
jgi:hypothetical protein